MVCYLLMYFVVYECDFVIDMVLDAEEDAIDVHRVIIVGVEVCVTNKPIRMIFLVIIRIGIQQANCF